MLAASKSRRLCLRKETSARTAKFAAMGQRRRLRGILIRSSVGSCIRAPCTGLGGRLFDENIFAGSIGLYVVF
jgi:hypothetical protein